ncbi:MAG: acyltransferase [Acidovorax sp.]|uniref:acyltransferase family protein n=1 Tax=Acidovorax sp. TaxID=1872122 RepID=UPI0025BEFC00|nr:acyltransferase family protein [Acidovorax sp.]MCE1191507.1 acyltransferase [Acidovorax sp.]
MTTNNHTYRPDIDGLRALAVTAVVVFHFLPTYLPGGFIGVDVFFVISGYLISKTIYSDISSGIFTITNFYERRAKRILPAFIVVSSASCIAAWLLLFPMEFVDFSKSLFWSGIFAPNFWFWMKSNYFGPAANQTPLLHYWSLGVEEQFYVIFPLLVLLVYRTARRALPLVLTVLFLISLFGSEWMLNRDPSQAFYMLPWRAFELLSGSLLALLPSTLKPTQRMQQATFLTAGSGLAAILFGMFFITKEMRFPGLLALVPCVSTALLIWAGGTAPNVVTRLLSASVMTSVGRISYSLYLIHWPLVVLGKRAFPNADPINFALYGISTSVILAFFSYFIVEQPVRRWAPMTRKPVLFATSGASLATILVVATMGFLGEGFPSKFHGSIPEKLAPNDWVTHQKARSLTLNSTTPEVFSNTVPLSSGPTKNSTPTLEGFSVNEALSFQQFDFKSLFRQGTCFLEPNQSFADYRPDLCLPKTGRIIVLWGDSHLAQYAHGLKNAMESDGFAIGQLTASACAPLVGVDVATRPNCRAFNDLAIATLQEIKPTLVIMSAVWTAELTQIAEMDKTIHLLTSEGIHVKIIGPSAIYKQAIPVLIAQRLQAKNFSAFSDNDIEEVVFERDAILSKYFSNRRDVEYISVLSLACPARHCPIFDNGAPLHFDTAHLTSTGSIWYGKKLEAPVAAGMQRN